jgi:deazaflavin-dependent oxidoreductase (nitroreductase family)
VTLPDGLARFNRRVGNPLMRTFTGRLPPFAIVVHRGRRSGREYRTPVMAFPGADIVVIPLAFGSERDWVRNVLAADGCALVRRGRSIVLTFPRVVTAQAGLPLMPRVAAPILRLLGVTECLQLQRHSTVGADRAGHG